MKINVLVAEDEMPIMRSICTAIEQCNPHFKVVATAFNGSQAIEILKHSQIDLVFLDINMPVLSGIEVLKFLKAENLNTQAVVLSGYRDFQYAQNALRYGALDYLLKPVKREDLTGILNKVEQLLLETQELAETESPAYSANNKSCYVASLYIGSYTMVERERLITDSHLKAKQLLEDSLAEVFAPDEFWFLDSTEHYRKLLCIDYQVEQPWLMLEQLRAKLEASPIVITLIMHDEIVSGQEIYRTLSLLNNHAYYGMQFDRCICQVVHATQIIQPQTVNVDAVVARITSDVTQPQLIQLYHECFANGQHASRYAVKEVTKRFFYEICRQHKSKISYIDIEEDILCAVEACKGLQDLIEKLDETVGTVLFPNGQLHEPPNLAMEIKQYLDQHYHEYISVLVLSRRFFSTASHVREVYRNQYDQSPMEYLLELRMTKAKELLLQNVTSKEVAAAVGFNDALYFSKAFKKYTGVSPSIYVKEEQEK